MEAYKKIEYTNIPIALSHLHIKEYTNILKRKDKTSRRTSSESNTACNNNNNNNNNNKSSKLSTQPFIIVANLPTANIHMFHSEVDA